MREKVNKKRDWAGGDCFQDAVIYFRRITAYELSASLVGSEVCIRDRLPDETIVFTTYVKYRPCLLYTSDAADEPLCVDLGGRRIIKKKQYLIVTNHDSLST